MPRNDSYPPQEYWAITPQEGYRQARKQVKDILDGKEKLPWAFSDSAPLAFIRTTIAWHQGKTNDKINDVRLWFVSYPNPFDAGVPDHLPQTIANIRSDIRMGRAAVQAARDELAARKDCRLVRKLCAVSAAA